MKSKETDYDNLNESDAVRQYVTTTAGSVLEQSEGVCEFPEKPDSLGDVEWVEWEDRVWNAAVDNLSRRMWLAATASQ